MVRLNHCCQLSILRDIWVTDYFVRLVGALAVTVPSCWYLLQNGPAAHHGHGGHGDEHGKAHGNEHGEEHKESKDEPESKDDEKSSENGDDTDSGDESKEVDTPDTSDDEDGKDEKEGKSKDDTSSNTAPTPKGDIKVYPDSKGASKKRTDSEKGKKQGKPEGADAESKDTVLL